MNRGAYVLGIVSLVVSALFLPSWFTIIVAILLIGLWRSYVFVIAVGVLIDTTFGISVQALGGFAYFYTTLFILLALMSVILERALIE